ncbi:MAG: hypothetical protein PHI52_03560 [Bacteroidales bacterium]|nr:hypothetical protein [Bacteroidales bacterium]
MLKKILIIPIVLVALLNGCKNKKPDEVSYDLKERLLPCSIQCGDEKSDSLPILSIDIFNQFIPHMKVYPGHKPILLSKIPSDWEVEYQLENLSSEFDIWIISNVNEVSHKALLTIKKTETNFTVISALLIAYSAAIEHTDSLESEEWTCEIDKDYSIKIKKRYDKIFSSVIDTILLENKLIQHEDTYHISLNGQISYQEPEIYETDYFAIIQFADTAESGIILDEDWIWNGIHMREQLEEKNVFFVEATQGFDHISILNYHGEEVDKINMSSFLTTYSKGYLFIKKDKSPKYHRYCPAEECVQKAFIYFEIDTVISNTEEIGAIEI